MKTFDIYLMVPAYYEKDIKAETEEEAIAKFEQILRDKDIHAFEDNFPSSYTILEIDPSIVADEEELFV